MLFSSDEPRVLQIRHVLEKIAAETRHTPASVATAWVLQHPSRPAVLTGSGRIAAIREAVAATSLELTRDQWFALWTASAGHEVP
jgi:predicted oxidoreductase